LLHLLWDENCAELTKGVVIAKESPSSNIVVTITERCWAVSTKGGISSKLQPNASGSDDVKKGRKTQADVILRTKTVGYVNQKETPAIGFPVWGCAKGGKKRKLPHKQ